jgi:hypothetical protein
MVHPFKAAPQGWSPAGGLAGADLVTFAVRARSCVRRSSMDARVYVHVAPSNPDVGAAFVRSLTSNGCRPAGAPANVAPS